MSLRTINDPSGLNIPLVERLIGMTAYDIVKFVAMNMDDIKEVVGATEQVGADKAAVLAALAQALEAAAEAGKAKLLVQAVNNTYFEDRLNPPPVDAENNDTYWVHQNKRLFLARNVNGVGVETGVEFITEGFLENADGGNIGFDPDQDYTVGTIGAQLLAYGLSIQAAVQEAGQAGSMSQQAIDAATAARSRGNHTGTQAIATVEGLADSLAAKTASSTLAASGGTALIGYGMKSLDKATPKSLSFFGIDPFTTASQHSLLEAALANAAADGLIVHGHPDAVYRKDGPLALNAQVFDGQGARLLSLSDGPNHVEVKGTGTKIKNLTNVSASPVRYTTPNYNGWTITATDFELESVRSEGVDASRGPGGSGFFFFGAKRGVITRPFTTRSKADNFHVTQGSQDLTFYSPRCVGGGDDMFAVVGYANENRNKRITTYDLRGEDNHARGIAILGGIDIHHYRPKIYRSSGAAVYVQSESSYNTHGNQTWGVHDLYAEDCVTGVGQNAGFAQPIIYAVGRDGTTTTPEGEVASRSIQDGAITGYVYGKGAAANRGLVVEGRYVRRLRLDLVLSQMTMLAECCQLGGEDLHGRIWIDGCAGVPIILTNDFIGDHAFDLIGGVGLRTSNPGIPSCIHVSNQKNWNSFHVDLLKFPDAGISAPTNMDYTKFTWRRAIIGANGNYPHP